MLPGSTGSVSLVSTPIEFGGANLTPADVIKQGQKGLVGGLVVQPQGASWAESDKVIDHQTATAGVLRETRASASVNGGLFRDFTSIIQKGLNHRYADGTAVQEIAAEQDISEDAEDSGQMGINYGSEPMWFRFGLAPNTPFTGAPSLATVPTAHEAYSNGLAGVNGDPATPVFTALAGTPTRLHLLEPAGAPRASTFTLHGHVWQRAPYVCPSAGAGYLNIKGNCQPTGWFPTKAGFEVASKAIGDNQLSFAMGAQDLVAPGAHFDLVLPSAGGSNAQPADYLLQDRTGFGNTSGLWGILRVTR